MSRRYPTAELYEERQRDFYRNGNGRSDRSYDELDLELRRGGDPRRSAPDFFHDDYNRGTAGPLVVRGQRDDDAVSRAPTQRREIEHDSLVIRGGRQQAPPPPSSARGGFDRDDMSSRRSEAPDRRRPREVEREETDISIRRREQSRPRSEVRDYDRDDIVFRRGDGARPRPREVEFEREEIKFRDNRDPPRPVERDEFTYRREERRDESRPGREREVEKDSLVIRNRERSLPPPQRNRGDLVAREREEFVVRRREPSVPPREREIIKDEIIIRRKEEQRSPTPPPPPPPPPEPEIRPPIIQEIITHHRHIDHGVERARSPTPPPPPPSPPRDDSLEISIRHRESRGGRGFEEDITFERETKSRELEISRTRARSPEPPRRSFTAPPDSEFEMEADFYNRKALERAYPGEAYNGATKDWAIVDVPPGTNRVRMDGIGGGSQEVTWQRYNGVRRSKFISGDDQRATDFGLPAPDQPRPKPKDMWTEITKDLVIKDAIDSMGYDYEETDYFFYVMEYLRYEDVLQLVEISDDIRRRRKTRIREIEFEREEIRDRRPPSGFDERYYEHEVSFDRHRHRSGFR